MEDKTTNKEIRKSLNVNEVRNKLEWHRLKPIERTHDRRLSKLTNNFRLKGKRDVGRPNKRWSDAVM